MATGTMEGSLSKWTNVMKGWQYRWFVLDDNAGLLSYYTSREKMMRGVRRGCVRLKGAVIGIDDDDDSTFTITVDSKTFHFQARDKDEREKWIRCLEDTNLRHAFGYKSASTLRLDAVKPAPTIQHFDKKLTEADAYLQILIEQTKALEKRMGPMEDEDKSRCEAILSHANIMLEQVKHTIVLLQIAKNTAYPVNGTYNPSSVADSEKDSPTGISGDEPSIELAAECSEARIRQLMPVYNTVMEPHHSGLLPNLTVPDTSYSSSEEEDFYDCNDNSELNTPTNTVPPRRLMEPHHSGLLPNLTVPDTSYSSSEEEDFYDCNDNSELNTPTNTVPPRSESTLPYDSSRVSAGSGEGGGGGAAGEAVASDQSSATATATVAATPSATQQQPKHRNSVADSFSRPDGSLDYDLLYEDPTESDISMETQGSVVTHLLSQVKIGMDLTKVVLPTFILERRSLLEMYADYFAHPDLFVSIADMKTERERMVAVVRWYLASYHAGRKSSVAKKPYNPVLGEVFQCHWDLPSEEVGVEVSEGAAREGGDDPSTTPPLVSDGPVPWCHRNQLTFVAEQVSHHPPISAFYAEHYNTKDELEMKRCVWLVCLRSILTVPWIELGGSVVIKCDKTGYKANVEFLTKPFYGGKKHRITADVFAPNEKKPFLAIAGEWNGQMEAKWADGRTEQFIDVDQLSVIKKIVRPIEQQSDNESRRLWKEVTAGLKLNNVQHATSAKSEIEQRQRIEAQQRRDAGVQWENKLFYPEPNDQWSYKHPLSSRLNSTSHR
ncbi:oxysterol-binding protein-related protein 9 [Nilaparvata lugens]|uniref:oxysterol-binding protein-related protein 9 n=1 Tax=Nilaparvata lugens TaxID=108931 RepID=UPI00193D8AFC|nr:oxysterol-binding protein-related protein 9 [Nilaparvata lugens]